MRCIFTSSPPHYSHNHPHSTCMHFIQGLTGTAVDLYAVASQEHEERGVTGAVGGILRQIPGTVVKPVILLSEATRHVLGGVKNQFVPDARREAKEKWKTIEISD